MDIKKIIMSKGLFIISGVGFLVGVIGMLVCLSFRGGRGIEGRDIIEVPIHRGVVEFPIEVYLATEFSEREKEIMRGAIEEWRERTWGKFDIKLVEGWEGPVEFNGRYYERYDKRTVWKLSYKEEEVERLIILGGYFEGISLGNMIVMIEEEMVEEWIFETTFKHELGHMVGMEHIKGEYLALMNKGGNGGEITEYDLIEFCWLYKCDN